MRLSKIELKGFKSIDGESGQTIPLGSVTVLLGANGSGKSNLVSFFKMLNYMTTGALQQYVGVQGASRLLFYGPKQTESIWFRLFFVSQSAQDEYEVKLSYGLPERLFVSGERVSFKTSTSRGNSPLEYYLESGGSELQLFQDNRKSSQVISRLLSGIRTYQFHDTSSTAKIKDRCYIDDAKYLRSDGGNLASFLRMLQRHAEYKKYYENIVRHITRVMPQFGGFELDVLPGNRDYVRLNWRDNSGRDYIFDPDQLSDGSLRFMALATLLLQPPSIRPKFIVLDEPELGLHPAAIAELAGIVRTVSHESQVLLATQSTRLVDEFTLDDLVIAERNEQKRCSIVKKLNALELSEWLECYSLSELWEKNVLGGQP